RGGGLGPGAVAGRPAPPGDPRRPGARLRIPGPAPARPAGPPAPPPRTGSPARRAAVGVSGAAARGRRPPDPPLRPPHAPPRRPRRPVPPGGGGPGMTPLRRPCALAALAALLSLAGAAPAQDVEQSIRAARQRFNAGTHVFRRCLFQAGFQPLKDFSALVDNPAASVLIVLGDPAPLSRVPGGLEKFVRDGGGVLVATDWKSDAEAGRQLLRTAGVTVSGRSFVNIDPAKWCYGQRDYRPFLYSKVNPSPPLLSNAGVDRNNLSRVATDAPSRLEV